MSAWRANKTEPAVCEYLFSVRRYPDWAHTWAKDTRTKPRRQRGLWATWHITYLSLGLFQSSSTSFTIVHHHVWACTYEVSGAPSTYGAQIPLANILSMNFKKFLPAVNHTTWRHVWLTESIIYSLSIVWGIDCPIGHMCLTVGCTLSWQKFRDYQHTNMTTCARKKHKQNPYFVLQCTCGLTVFPIPYLLWDRHNPI